MSGRTTVFRAPINYARLVPPKFQRGYIIVKTKHISTDILAVCLSPDECEKIHRVCPKGWIIRTASSLGEARLSFLGGQISVVVSKDCLPDGNWQDLLEHASGVLQGPNIVITARLADERLWAEVLNLGGYDVLAQPFDDDEVFRVIDSARRNWHSQWANAASYAAAVA